MDVYAAKFRVPRDMDATPPVLSTLADITVNATGPGGARVTFAATATDAEDPNPMVSCDPPSGGVFPIGTTTGTCTATDASGNTASAQFSVVVRGACDQIDNLVDELLAASGLPPHLVTALRTALRPVLDRCRTAPTRGVCWALNAFAALVRTGVRDSGLRERILADVARISAVLACPLPSSDGGR